MASISRLTMLSAGVERGVDLTTNTIVFGSTTGIEIGSTTLIESQLSSLISLISTSITALTGDVTATGSGGSAVATLATVNSNTGSFGGASSIPVITVNGKGLITAASTDAVVAPAGTLSGTTLNSTVVTSSLTSVGIVTAGTWDATPVAISYGGTGATSAASAFNALNPMTTQGDVIYEASAGVAARLGIGSTGQVLTVSSGIPSWQTPATGSVTSVALADGSSTPIFSISGSPVTSSGTLTFTLDTQLANLVFAGPASGSAAQPTFRSLVLADIPSLSSVYLPLSGGTLTGALNLGSHQINALATPTLSTDAANKGYVDAAVNGLTWKGPVQVYAASNVPLTGSTPLVVDGHTVVNGDLLLLGNQTTASQNGEYTAAISGGSYVLTANGQPTAIGDAWLVLDGTAYADSAFVSTAAVPAAAFIQFAGPNSYIFSAPLSLSGNTVSITQATTSTNGYLSSTDWNTFNTKQAAGNYITALTGDATASGPGSAALTLATVNSNTGSFGSSTSIPSFTVNGKGLITAASSNAVVAPAGTLSGTVLNSTVVSSSLTSVGTIATGVWNGTTIAIPNGGTGATSAAAAFNNLSPLTTTGDLIYEVSAGVAGRLAIGTTGQVLTVSGGVPSWGAASSGTVTSVALADGSTTPIFSISGSPVTSSGTLTQTLRTQSANAVFAGPASGSAAQPTFRALTAADVPASQSIQLTLVAGQAFSANTSYAVRYGINGNGETAGRVYAADYGSATPDNFWVIGMASGGAGVAIGGNIVVTIKGALTLGSSDTAFGSNTSGLPVYLGASGAFSVTAPTTSGQACFKIGITTSTTTIFVDGQLNGVN